MAWQHKPLPTRTFQHIAKSSSSAGRTRRWLETQAIFNTCISTCVLKDSLIDVLFYRGFSLCCIIKNLIEKLTLLKKGVIFVRIQSKLPENTDQNNSGYEQFLRIVKLLSQSSIATASQRILLT